MRPTCEAGGRAVRRTRHPRRSSAHAGLAAGDVVALRLPEREVLHVEVAERERLARLMIQTLEELHGLDEALHRPLVACLRPVDLAEQAQRLLLAALVAQAAGEIT
ncbi:hypothetical protein [Streptomyces murinus]|uniref:hypothetical protein n=1 Tax=Streptomyces murinus TaxID=33900 RepID=UPI00380E9AC4